MGLEPEEDIGAVFDGSGEGVFWGEAVLDAYDHRVELLCDRVAPADIVEAGAYGESTAVEIDDDRVRLQ